MRLGLATIAGRDRPLGEVVDAARRAGFAFVELSERPPHAGRMVRDGMPVDVLGSYLGFDGRIDEAGVDAAVGRALALGAELIRVWAGGTDLRAVAAGIARVADAGAGVGLAVTIERHTGGLATDVAACERLLDAVDRPNAGLCWQPLDAPSPEHVAGIADDARRLLPRSNHVHVKNYTPGDPPALGGPIRGGVLDWHPVLEAARDLAPTARWTIEFVAAGEEPFAERVARAAADVRALAGVTE